MDLAEFLLARIAEDEAVARAAFPSPWEFDGVSSLLTRHGPQGIVVHPYMDGETSVRTPVVETALFGERVDGRPTAVHIARHDPARVLAECEAKRRIVGDPEFWQHTDPYDAGDRTALFVMKCLALPYTDHPDYRRDWRP